LGWPKSPSARPPGWDTLTPQRGWPCTWVPPLLTLAQPYTSCSRDIPLGSLLVSFHVNYRPLKPSGVHLTGNCWRVLKEFGISGSSSRAEPSPSTWITCRLWRLWSGISDPWTARQCHHLAYMAEFTSDIQHVASQDNVAVDALSWPPVASPSSPSFCAAVVADLCGIAACQQPCPSTQQASHFPSL
jgi:hypothetical protein